MAISGMGSELLGKVIGLVSRTDARSPNSCRREFAP